MSIERFAPIFRFAVPGLLLLALGGGCDSRATEEVASSTRPVVRRVDAGPQEHRAPRIRVSRIVSRGGEAVRFRANGSEIGARLQELDVRVDARATRIARGTAVPASLGKSELVRGGRSLGHAGAASIDEHGDAVRTVADGIVERLSSSVSELEQSWSFEHEPIGEGDLVVRVPVSATGGVHADDFGLRIGRDSAALHYSHAIFVDADGRTTDVVSRIEGNDIVLRVPDAVLRAARYPAVLDPTITAASPIASALAGAQPAFGDQRMVAMAGVSTTRGQVVYLDLAEPTVTALETRGIDATGAPVGSTVRIDVGVDFAVPAIACVATGCLVAYTKNGTVYARMLDANGALVGTSAIELGAIGYRVNLAASGDANGYAVAWSDRVTSTGSTINILVRRTAVDGTPVGAAAVQVGTSAGLARVSVGTMASTTVVAWDETVGTAGRLLGARVDVVGTLLDAAPVVLVDAAASLEAMPRLAQRSADLALVYTVDSTRVHGAPVLVSPSLTLGTATSLVTTGGAYRDIFVAGNGDKVELGTASYSAPYYPNGAAYTVNCYVLSSTLSVSYSSMAISDLDSYDSGALMATTSRVLIAAGNRDYEFTWVNSNGFDVLAVGSSNTLSVFTTGAASTRQPAVSFEGGQFLVTFLEDGFLRGIRVSAVRFGVTGTRLDASPIVLSTGGVSGTIVGHVRNVSYGIGNSHMAAWQTRVESGYYRPASGSVETLSIDTNATPSVGLKLQITASTYPFGLVSGATTYAAYYDLDSMGRRRSGNVGTAYVGPISTSTIYRNSVVSYGDIGAAWNASSFDSLDLSSVSTVALNANESAGPGIARGASSVLVVRRLSPGSSTAATGTLLNAAGTSVVRASFVIGAGAAPIGPVRVAFDGTYYNVVYARGSALEIVRVDNDGAVIDPSPSILANDVAGSTTPAVASDRNGRVLVAYESYDANAAVRAQRVVVRVIDWNDTSQGAANGTACTGGLGCASGFCIDGVCCDSLCGNGSTTDCQACSVAAGAAVDGSCGVASSATICRASAGPCDVADTCDGVAQTCPVTDVFVPAGTLCGAVASQPCETDQRCTGSAAACPALGVAPTTVVCRPSAAPCDAEERCNGTAKTCPADVLSTSGTVCRAAAGPCDTPETCDGVTDGCPEDVLELVGVICRPSASACDAVETCTGSDVACPTDMPSPAGTQPCRDPVSVCDVAEYCDGTSFSCPMDRYAGTQVVCRPSAAPCDVAEYCTGTSSVCPPADAMRPEGYECRASAGDCDVAEVCTGKSMACPEDVLRSRGELCRPASGICDTAEACTGGNAQCPLDRQRVDGSSCGDGFVCNGDEVCSAGACVAGEPLVCSADSPCLESTGECSQPTRAAGSCAVRAGAPAEPSSGGLVAALGLLLLALRRRAVRLAVLALPLLMLPACVCGVGRVDCGGRCIDVAFDESNCGGCGVSCGTGQCIDAACVSRPTTGMPCDADVQCIDGDACDGVERCVQGFCRTSPPLECDDGLACTTDECNSDVGSCVSLPTTDACGITQ